MAKRAVTERVPGMASYLSLARRCGVALLVVAVLALLPLAAAESPDPIWIPGAYDGGDLDDLVLANTGSILAPSSTVVLAHSWDQRTNWLVASLDVGGIADPAHPPVGVRAPPYPFVAPWYSEFQRAFVDPPHERAS